MSTLLKFRIVFPIACHLKRKSDLLITMSLSSWVNSNITKANAGMKDIVDKAVKNANETLAEVDVLAAIPDSVMDAKMKSALRDISKIGAEMDKKLSATGKHTYPFLLNVAILRLYIRTRLIREGETKDCCFEDCSLDDDLFAQAFHYLRYSDLSYQQLPRIAERDIIIHELDDGKASNINMPRHIVFFDHLTHSIVVAIRGTASMSDIITDLSVDTEPFVHNGVHMVAHSGIAQAAETLLGPIRAAIAGARRMKGEKYRAYNVVVTGHSLGAGTACLLGMRLSEKQPGGEQPSDVTVFAFAPPPVLSEPAYCPPHCNIHTFVNNSDVVPRCCKLEIYKMLLAVGQIDRLAWDGGKRAHLVATSKQLKPEEMKLLDEACSATNYTPAERSVVESEVPLYAPGTSYVMLPSAIVPSPLNPQASTSKSVSPPSTGTPPPTTGAAGVESKFSKVLHPGALYSGFLFTGDSMLSDHKADNYIKAFVATEK